MAKRYTTESAELFNPLFSDDAIKTLHLDAEKRNVVSKNLEAKRPSAELEVERIAITKFEKLTRDDFHDYAVRFVNINEYKKII